MLVPFFFRKCSIRSAKEILPVWEEIGDVQRNVRIKMRHR